MQNCCVEIVSVFLLFIEIFVSVVGISKWFTGISVLENAILLFWFSFLVHGCAFLLLTAIKRG